MTAPPSSPTVQICRTCGGGAPVDAHFCSQCTKILTLNRHGDYFSFLGFPRKLEIDQPALEQKFRTLSRQFHPDFFYNATPAERRASLERSSYLNDAYRTLKQPVARIAYLLELEGFAPSGAGNSSNQVPPGLLEEVFALNEELDEVRELKTGGAPADAWRERLERARLPIERKSEEHEQQLRTLSSEWDALPEPAPAGEKARLLASLRDRMLERNYINNLLGTIERELKA